MVTGFLPIVCSFLETDSFNKPRIVLLLCAWNRAYKDAKTRSNCSLLEETRRLIKIVV